MKIGRNKLIKEIRSVLNIAPKEAEELINTHGVDYLTNALENEGSENILRFLYNQYQRSKPQPEEQSNNSLQLDMNDVNHSLVVGKIVLQLLNITKRQANTDAHYQEYLQTLWEYLAWCKNKYGIIKFQGLQILRPDDGELIESSVINIYDLVLATLYPAHNAAEVKDFPLQKLIAQNQYLAIIGGMGCGKTTFLRYIAYVLASSALHKKNTAKAILQLPSAAIPLYIPLAAYSKKILEAQSSENVNEMVSLIDFAAVYLSKQSLVANLTPSFVQMLLREGLAVVLFDGFDEIDDSLRIQVKTEIEQLVQAYAKSRFILTSRPSTYRGNAQLGSSLVERDNGERLGFWRAEIRPMTAEQIADFIRRWLKDISASISRDLQAEAILRDIEGLEKKRHERGQKPLITTPLLAILVALARYNRGGKRPPIQQIAALYDHFVNTILGGYYKDATWDEYGQEEEATNLTEIDRKQYIKFTAYLLHTTQKSLSVEEITQALVTEYQNIYTYDETKSLLKREFTQGSIVAFGDDGSPGFIHPSFKEYLTAVYLVDSATNDVDICEFFRIENRALSEQWREVVLFTAGILDIANPLRAKSFLQALLSSDDSLFNPTQKLLIAELVGSSVIELNQNHQRGFAREVAVAIRERLKEKELDLDNITMNSLGRVLNHLGDPHNSMKYNSIDDFNLQLIDNDHKQRLFRIGCLKHDKSASANENSHDQMIFVAPFRIASYPVTVAQYRPFVSFGYKESGESFWTDAGRRWRRRNRISMPREWYLQQDNQPVTGISWYEAQAYCNWLTFFLGGERIFRLPTEVEWEKAASSNRKNEKTIYPWGDTFVPAYANTAESGANGVAAVGIFEFGKNTNFEVYDMSGNVFEWCSSIYYDYPYDSERSEQIEGEARRVQRGGSWLTGAYEARTTFRRQQAPEWRSNDVGFRVAMSIE